MTCQNCGAQCPTENSFCSATCREAFYNRMSKRGRVAMPLLLAWRAGRGSGADSRTALAELCAYADHCNAEDRAANRPPMAQLIRQRKAHGTGVSWRERR